MNDKEEYKLKDIDNKKIIIIKENKTIKRNKINTLSRNKIYFFQKNNIMSFIFIFFIIFLPIFLSKRNKRNLYSDNEITLIVKGVGGYRSFLSSNIQNLSSVIINGVKQETPISLCLLNDPENTIILSWDSPLTSCDNMFYGLETILSMDFSKFDSSKVTSMNSMFYGCPNLKTITLKNLDTSSVKDMSYMFQECISLISLDLSDFDTSSLTSMKNMFNGCTSLISLDLSSFNTISLQNLEGTFYKDYSLISLDLSSFNISSLIMMRYTFNYCKSLIYINLISFVENDNIDIANIFSEELSNLTYCINENKSPKITSNIKNINNNNNCNDICFSETRKIIVEKKKCIDDCTNDDIYIYEYNKICYESEQNKDSENIK